MIKLILFSILLINISFSNDFELLKDKAEKGDSKAQSDLGIAYALGNQIKQDFNEAKKWYLLSAEQNSPFGQHNLGAMYFFGEGVEPDFKEAKKWYQLAANQKFRRSELALGSMYLYGKGVEKNIDTAKKYISKSCNQEFEPACKVYSNLIYQLTNNEKKVIQTLSEFQLNFEFENSGNPNLNYLGNYVFFFDNDLYNLFNINALRAKNILNNKNDETIFNPSFLVNLNVNNISILNNELNIQSKPYAKNNQTIDYVINETHISFAPESYENISKGENITLSCSKFINFNPTFDYLKLGNCMTQEASVKMKSLLLSSLFLSISKQYITNSLNFDDVKIPMALFIANVLYASKISNNFENIDINNPQEINEYVNQLYFIDDDSFYKFQKFYTEIGLSKLDYFFNSEI